MCSELEALRLSPPAVRRHPRYALCQVSLLDKGLDCLLCSWQDVSIQYASQPALLLRLQVWLVLLYQCLHLRFHPCVCEQLYPVQTRSRLRLRRLLYLCKCMYVRSYVLKLSLLLFKSIFTIDLRYRGSSAATG